jgi:choline monooxygenase
MTPFVFEPRLERAATLPARCYTDPQLLEAENERIFARTWQLVGHTGQLQEHGSYFTAVVGKEPIIVVRGADGELAALSNVCRHRAGPVARTGGRCRTFRCGYHGWTYGLDGRLLGTPELEGIEDFDRAAFALPRFRVGTWLDLVFVNLDPGAPALEEYLGDLATRFDARRFAAVRMAHRKEWEIACNWKVYVDNYLEGYHIPIVHPSLFRELDYSRYRTETGRFFSIQHAPIRRAERIRGETDAEAEYFWLFPNLMINVYPDNFSTNLILPRGHQRTVTLFDWYFADPGSETTKRRIEETVQFSDEIQIEDINICEAVQRGLEAPSYTSGRYAPARENGVHHFHSLLSEFLR